jgi:hypothetical protein
MGIDIFSIKPTEVSRDLSQKIVLVYGEAKSGKTTNAVKFPKPLLLAFEKGYNALSGVMAQPIVKWTDFEVVLRQLKKPEAHKAFKTIIIDTASIAYDLAEKRIIEKNDVEAIGDVPYGGGYGQTKKLFDEALRSIPLMGYGLVMIAHADDKQFTDETGKEYSRIVPALSKRAREIVTGMADIIAFAKNIDEDGKTVSKLFLRGTQRFEAGSRFKYTPEVIPFTYDALAQAVADAVEKEGNDTGKITDEAINNYEDKVIYDYEEEKAKADDAIRKIVAIDKKYVPKITKIVASQLGEQKLKDTTEDQADVVALIAADLEELFNNISK